MTPEAALSPVIETLADLHERLGCVPLYRINWLRVLLNGITH